MSLSHERFGRVRKGKGKGKGKGCHGRCVLGLETESIFERDAGRGV